ncbi:MAG TPA: hypothetical protein PKD72_00500 [Gemmatales bacterium]|nr:hypothetical protein [Gemmatales bacterium]
METDYVSQIQLKTNYPKYPLYRIIALSRIIQKGIRSEPCLLGKRLPYTNASKTLKIYDADNICRQVTHVIAENPDLIDIHTTKLINDGAGVIANLEVTHKGIIGDIFTNILMHSDACDILYFTVSRNVFVIVDAFPSIPIFKYKDSIYHATITIRANIDLPIYCQVKIDILNSIYSLYYKDINDKSSIRQITIELTPEKLLPDVIPINFTLRTGDNVMSKQVILELQRH